MKKFFISLWLFVAIVSANAQTDTKEPEADSVEVQFVQLPDSTVIGSTKGKKVSKEIGPTGGTIVSEDGKIELIFPADALNKLTEISIQAAESVIPNGNKAYQFEPSGIQFQKPVQLIFQYTDEEAATCPPELKFMALQDHKGKWEYMNYDDWDSTAKSLKGSIKHFSAFVDGNEVELNNTEITLKAGKTHQFSLNVVQPPLPPDNPGEDELPPLPPRTIDRGSREELWKVNNRTGGSAKHGTISPIRGQPIKATYRAPAGLTADPITVTLELNDVMMQQIRIRAGRRGWMSYNRRRTSPVASFSCKVKLFVEYKVTVSHNINIEDDVKMSDSSSFNLKISIDERAGISGIQNQLAKLYIRQTRCRAIYVNASTCVGMINVTGIKTSNIRPAAAGDFAWVDIFFKPAPFDFPIVNFPPCGSNRASPTTPPVVLPNAFPMWLSFQLKNEKQFISLGEGAAVSRPDPEDITATIEPIME